MDSKTLPQSNLVSCDAGLFNVINQGVALYKPVENGLNFEIVGVNPAAERMDRVVCAEVVGRLVTDVFPGVEEFGLLDVFRRVYRTGETEVMPASVYSDGRIQGWRENSVYRLPDGNVVTVYDDVTVREQARIAREVSDTRYRLLTESTLDGVWDWNIAAGTVYLSPRWKQQLGFDDHELPNVMESWSGRLHPSDKDGVLSKLNHFLKHPGPIWSAEFRMLKKDGDYKWTLARGAPMLDRDGAVIRILGVHVDIDVKKKSEVKLAENEQRLKLALRGGNQGLYDLNVQTGEAIVNAEYAQMLGYDPETFSETNAAWLQRVHPDDYDEVISAFKSYTTGEIKDYRIEFRQQTKSGDWKWILSVGRIIERDESGLPLRMIGTHTDISELKNARQRLKQAMQVFSSTMEGVSITDTEGNILDINKAFTEITGYSREEIIGKNQRILQSGRHDKEFYRAMWQSLNEEGCWRGEIWNKRKDGSVYPEMLVINRVEDRGQGASGFIAMFSDITADKENERQLDFLAHHDPLTDLPNRVLFNAILDQAISRSHRTSETLAVFFVDLDRFKYINDTYGHNFGDQLIRQVATRLKNTIRGDDRVARLSGDEFVAFLENIGNSTNAAIVVQKIIHAFNEPFLIDGIELSATCSIGISLYPDDSQDRSSLLRYADMAMYRAKEEGRNAYQFYTNEMTSAASEYLFMENAIRKALEDGQFHLVYQPQVDISGEKVCGLEALIRWQHPEKGAIPPSVFIPFAEKLGLINDVGEWVLHEACSQAGKWEKQGLHFGRMAVNISGRQVQREGFSKYVISILETHDLASEFLELEVTESYLMDHENESVRQLMRLRGLGVSVAIDDFGTGYSSLSYLKHLPIDKLKIDRSFVRDIPNDTNDMAISEAVIALGSALGLDVISEGVETSEQLEFLQSKGCSHGQGFYYSRPLIAADAEKFIMSKKPNC